MEENVLQGNGLDKKPSAESVMPESVFKESFLKKLKFKIPSFSFVQTFLIPMVVVILTLLIGVGGTFFIASSVFTKPVPTAGNTSSVSESDIPQVPTTTVSAPTEAVPTATPTPSFSPDLLASPTPVASAAAGWTPYSFAQVFLSFSYPPGWFVSVGATSGPPYITVQNFSGPTPINIQNKYSILISRLAQVGITTVSSLTTQLALNAASSTYINGVNMGQVGVITAAQTTINGYQALERTVSYSAFPTTNFYELYVLDGVSNVIKFMPQLDTTFGQPYFDTLVSTIRFTN